MLPEAQWHANAARVEQEANHELERLTDLLELDSQQQEHVFAALARKSPYWLPGMAADNRTRAETPTPTAPATPISQRPTSSNVDRPSRGNSGSAEVAKPIPAVALNGGSPVAESISEPVPEISDALDPDQMLTIIDDEMDRQAWWEEVLLQLLPPDGTEMAAGAPIKEFDGGEVLLDE